MSYEAVFYTLLLVTLAVWIKLEQLLDSCPSISPWRHLRRSYFFLFFTLLSFFGLGKLEIIVIFSKQITFLFLPIIFKGNLASLNSFDPSSVRSFVTTFSPFTMGALLLWKITVPFITVSSALWAFTLQQQQTTMKAMYLMILLLSSVMAVQFFHWVTSTGSWLDIGTSISHYVICQLTVLFVMVLRSVVQLLTHGPIYFPAPGSTHKYEKD